MPRGATFFWPNVSTFQKSVSEDAVGLKYLRNLQIIISQNCWQFNCQHLTLALWDVKLHVFISATLRLVPCYRSEVVLTSDSCNWWVVSTPNARPVDGSETLLQNQLRLVVYQFLPLFAGFGIHQQYW